MFFVGFLEGKYYLPLKNMFSNFVYLGWIFRFIDLTACYTLSMF